MTTARWIGATAADDLDAARRWSLHSAFESSVNLAADGARRLLHVSATRDVDGLRAPFGVELDRPAWTVWHRAVLAGDPDDVGVTWTWDPRRGAFTGSRPGAPGIDLGPAWRDAVGDSTLPSTDRAAGPVDLGPLVGSMTGSTGLLQVADPNTIRRRVWSAVASLVAGGTDGAEWLLGRGPGLTPSGDDVLVGVVGALHVAGLPGRSRVALRRLGSHIVTSGPLLTTDVSCAYLRDAAHGRFAGPLRRVLVAVGRGDRHATRSALHDLRTFGHTSGADTVLGLTVTCEMLRRGRRTADGRPDVRPASEPALEPALGAVS